MLSLDSLGEAFTREKMEIVCFFTKFGTISFFFKGKSRKPLRSLVGGSPPLVWQKTKLFPFFSREGFPNMNITYDEQIWIICPPPPPKRNQI